MTIVVKALLMKDSVTWWLWEILPPPVELTSGVTNNLGRRNKGKWENDNDWRGPQTEVAEVTSSVNERQTLFPIHLWNFSFTPKFCLPLQEKTLYWLTYYIFLFDIYITLVKNLCTSLEMLSFQLLFVTWKTDSMVAD